MLVVGTLRTDELHQHARCGPGGRGCSCSAWPRRPVSRVWTSSRPQRWWASCCRAGRVAAPGRAGPPAVGWCAAARRGTGERRCSGPPVRGSVVCPGDPGRGDPASVRRAVAGRAGHRGRRRRRPPHLRPRPVGSGRGCSAQVAAASLDELVDRHFVHEESPGWFGFRHALIRDAIEVQRAAGQAPCLACAGRRGGPASPRAGRRRLPVGAPRGGRAARRSLGGRRGRRGARRGAVRAPGGARPAEPRGAMPARRATTGGVSNCSPAAPPRRRPPTTTRRRREDYELARDLLAEYGDPVAAAALLPGLVAARHLLGDPLPARIACWTGTRGRRPADDGDGRQRVRAGLLAAKAAAYLVDDRLDDAIEAGSRHWPRPARRTSGPASTRRPPWGPSWCSPDGWRRAGASSSRPPAGPGSWAWRRRPLVATA